jgi:hypothetical protein
MNRIIDDPVNPAGNLVYPVSRKMPQRCLLRLNRELINRAKIPGEILAKLTQ